MPWSSHARRVRSTLIAAALSLSIVLFSPEIASGQGVDESDLPSLEVTEAPSIRVENLSLADGLAQGTIYQMIQDDDGFIWFGTQSGLHRYDGQEFKVYTPTPFDTTSIQSGWTWGVDQARDGSIWASTMIGLSRLDPVTGTFTNFRHDPADSTTIADGRVFDSIELSDGSIWVASDDGVSRLDDERTGVFKRYEHVHDDPETLAAGAYFLREGPEGYLWVSTADGLDRIDPETREIKHHFQTGTHRGPDYPQAILGSTVDPGDEHVFWYGTGRGLMRFDTRTGEREVWVPFPDDEVGTQRNVIVSVENDPNLGGVLWLGTSGGGLLRFDSRTEEFSGYRHDPGDPNSLASNMANQVFADRSGTMWVGYGNKGLGKFNPTSVSIAHLKHDPDELRSSLPAGNIWAIIETGRYLWAGVNSDAGEDILTRYDLSTGDVTTRTADSDDSSTFWPGTISALLMGSDGRLWVGTNGLSWCDPMSLRCRRLPRTNNDENTLSGWPTHALFESPDEPGIIWRGSIGAQGGLQRYDSRTGEAKRYMPDDADPEASPNNVMHIIRGSDGALWLATAGAGLTRFDRESETFTRYSYDPTDTTGISGDYAEAIIERDEEPGILWVGTVGAGLDRFDMETGLVRHFTTEDGLADAQIYGMLEDEDGLLWMSTNRGISSFDPADESFRNYGLDDGLRELEFMQNGFSNGRGGMLYFGDVSGITAFVPSRLNVNTEAPEIAFTALRVDGEPVQPSEGGILEAKLEHEGVIRLPYSRNNFSVDFVALHFSNPTKNRYAYRLEGYDDEWIEGGFQRTAAYTNLPPGDYTFRVRAANPDGVWNDDGIALDVTVDPPWYRTYWAYALFALMLGGAVFGGDRIQRRRLLKQERARAELEQIELRAEAAESEAKALQAENERKKNIELLSDIGQEITSSLDFETIFGRLYTHVNDLTDAPIFGVGIYDEERDLIDYRMAMENGKRYEPYTRDASDKNQFPVWCIENREAVFINDVQNEYDRYIDHYEERGTKLEDGSASRVPESLIYLPLVTKDKVIGVITVQSFEKNAYTENDLNLLRTMASYASVALDNANAYRQLNGTIGELRQTQEQLVQQEKMASLGQLTAGIAHEIKNPLNFVTNFAELNSELATELREILEANDASSIAKKHEELEDLVTSLHLNAKQIAKHGRRADSIVRGMMEHARPGDAEQFAVSVNGFVEEYVNLAWHGYRARFPDLEVTVDQNLDEDVGNAKVAPQEMGRVIINLVGNALDVVRDQEGGAVSVSTKRKGKDVEIRVSDNGPGVPEHLRVKIFEPFFTTKKTGEGTGLGLSMSHDIVTQGHHGTLRVEDTPGGGATFVITIPA